MIAMETIILGIVFLHKFVICRNLKDIVDTIKEIFFSTLICLNNVFYQSLDIAIMMFQNIKWVPMKKDPFESLTMKKTIQTLWPSTILGVVLINFGINNSPYGTFFALPILTSFALSIPVAYATSLPWPLRISDNK
jgi:membrane glycosyltransferase